MSKKIARLASYESYLLSTKFWWLVAVIYGFARIPTWYFPFDSDHWIFYYVGSRWFDGLILYLQVWDHKSPLIFAINGLMASVLGDNIVLHRLFFTAISILSIWLMYITLKRVLSLWNIKQVELSARVGTLIFSFWASLAQFTNSGNTTESFAIPALLLALYAYLRWIDSKHLKWLLYSGVGISLLVFLKINFSILLVPLVIDYIWRQRSSIPRLCKHALVWAAPLFAQMLLWYSYFGPRNLVNEWWIAMVSFNGKYLRAGWAGNLSGQLIFLVILACAALFFVGCYYFLFKDIRNKKPTPAFLITIAGSTLLFSIILGTFYGHYYIIVMPYLAIVMSVYWKRIIGQKILLALAIFGIVASFGIAYRQLYNSFLGPAATDFSNMEKAATAVNEISEPNDKIFFYGYGATFYQLADRDSGSRFISASHLLIDEREGFGFGLTDRFIGDMGMSGAKYVIIDPVTKNLYSENTKAVNFINRRYESYLDVAGYEILRLKQ